MKTLILFTLLVIQIKAARDKCPAESKVTELFPEVSKNPSKYIQFTTYGGYLRGIDVCDTIDNVNFKELLYDLGLGCYSSANPTWCDGEIFKCGKGNLECYHVEHIIDQSNSDTDCETRIIGNLIIAYGKWNNQVGQLCWRDVKREKLEVYGKSIFCDAALNVYYCDDDCYFNLPECGISDNIDHIIPIPRDTSYITEQSTSPSEASNIAIGIIILGSIAIILIGLVCAVYQIYKCCKKPALAPTYITVTQNA